MNRRQFAKGAATLPLAGSALVAGSARGEGRQHMADENEVYELRRYNMVFRQPQQELERYFEEALIPALNRQGVEHVGVFSELGKRTPVTLYVLIAHPGFESFYKTGERLAGDDQYQAASLAFESRSSGDRVYVRYDTWVLHAFDGLKRMIGPDTSSERLFELRTYEGHNDDAVARKTVMFNNEELDLFYKTKLNPVFFGKMIAGPAMPALTYMLTFKDMAERDASWDAFGNHPDWQTMKAKPEYADTVSNIIRIFLTPTSYSQV
jgi:hypothetical protein